MTLDLAPAPAVPAPDGDDAAPVDYRSYVGADAEGLCTLHLLVEGVECGACVARIERSLGRRPEVAQARVNLSTKRLVLKWRGPAELGAGLAESVADLGFRVVPFDPGRLKAAAAREETELLRAMAVAGFAAANVMLLSVAVWAGLAQDMGPATRSLLYWFSALIALPAILYAGRPFFRSALGALKAGHTNMDVPISLAVLLTAAMSLAETMTGGRHAYFDSAVTLLFFLLVGRFLDRRARGRARSAAERLLALGGQAVTVLDADGTRHDRAGRRRAARRGRRTGERGPVGGRYQPDHRRDPAGRGRSGRSGVRRHAQPVRAADPDRHRGRRGHPAGRNRPADGAGRAAQVPLCRAGRPGGAALCPGGARAGAADPARLDPDRRAGLAAGAADRGVGADHHLPLRGRAGGAGGPGDRQRPADAPGNPAEIGDRAGTADPDRHRGVRQDRHADPRPAGAGNRRRPDRRRPGRPGRAAPGIRWPARCAAPCPACRSPPECARCRAADLLWPCRPGRSGWAAAAGAA